MVNLNTHTHMYIYIYIFKSNQLLVNICIYIDIRLKRCVYIYTCSYRYISRNVYITKDLLNFNLSSRLCFLLVQANNATKWFLKNWLYMSIYVYICTRVYVICLQIYLYIYIYVYIYLYIYKTFIYIYCRNVPSVTGKGSAIRNRRANPCATLTLCAENACSLCFTESA